MPRAYIYIESELFYKIKSFSNKPKKMIAYDFLILIFIYCIAIGGIMLLIDDKSDDEQ